MRYKQLLCSLVVVFSGAIHATTVQDLKLPSPVAVEAVLPHFVVGRFGVLSFESELVITNPTDDWLAAEFTFFYADGRSALDLADQLRTTNFFDVLADDAYFKRVAPHSTHRLLFTVKRIQNPSFAFEGWAVVRSNGPIVVNLDLTTTHVPSGKSTRGDLPANYAAAKTATARVPSFKGQIYSADPVFQNGQHIGWRLTTAGIALLNPGNTLIRVMLELENKFATAELPPRTKKSFLISELFDFFAPSSSGVRVATLKVTSESENAFAITVVRLDLDTDLSGNITPVTINAEAPAKITGPGGLLYFDPFQTPIQRPFDFPVQVRDELKTENIRLTLTAFGFFVSKANGEGLQFTRFLNGNKIATGLNAGILVVYGTQGIPIIFTGSRKLLIVDAWSGTLPPKFEELPNNVIRVTAGDACNRLIILLDKGSEELLSVQMTRDPGAFCL